MARLPRCAAVTVFAVLALSGVQPISGQGFQRTLTTPDATHREAFSSIGGIRELPDGRVLIADPLGQALVALDMATGRVDTLGRVGPGPGEYRQPDALFSLPGDSTLLLDLGNGRLTVLGPDLAFGETMPMVSGRPGPGMGMSILIPRGSDSEGRLYFQPMGGMRPGRALPDSAPVARFDRSTKTTDTVAMVKLEERKTESSGGARNQAVRMRPTPMSPQDGWAVGWDGRVAVARAAPYRVDWVDTDGRTVQGPAIEYRPERVRQDDKAAWIERANSGGLNVRMQMQNGQARASFSRGGGGSDDPFDQIDEYEWPDVMPAFQASGLRISPEGHAWIERYGSAGSPPVYDVFDQQGERIGTVTLPEGRRVAGFGRGTVYLSFGDEFDLQYLERYRLSS